VPSAHSGHYALVEERVQDQLRVGLKADGWHGDGTLVLAGDRLFVDWSSTPIDVPEGDAVIVVPYLRVPWYGVSLQLGSRRAAIVPFWKRKKLVAMLHAAGRVPTTRRTIVALTARA
jgi:hypothetical protein